MQKKEADIREFYQAFRQRLKADTKEDIDDLQYAINSTDLISKELSKHDFKNLVIDKGNAQFARDLAIAINKDVNLMRKRYSQLKKLLKER